MQLRPLSSRQSPGALRRRAARIVKRQLRGYGPRIYGLMTFERYWHFRSSGVHLHIFLNGVDVTTDCAAADDRQGWAVLYQRDRRGKIIVDRAHEGPVMTLSTGIITIEKGAPIN
jgi:hypothetical protein